MSKRDKLIQRFLSVPRDFSWRELVTLLGSFGYRRVSKGTTSGSRVMFLHQTLPPMILHKPHPTPTLKRYQLEQIAEMLKREGLI